MTKAQIKASLEVIQNLFDQAISLSDALISQLGDSQQVEEAVRLLEERYPVESALEALDEIGIINDLEEGEEFSYPMINFESARDLSDVGIKIQLPDKDALQIYTNQIYDYEYPAPPTVQAGVVYYSKDGDVMDLCMAEIRKGSYAQQDGLDEENRDISLITWADPFDESYTRKDTLKYDDIKEALHIDEPVEEDLDEIEDIPKEESYEYWRENIMDERLEYLDSDEKFEMYLQWKNNKEEPEYEME